MIRNLFCFCGSGYDPYENLAIEETLLKTREKDSCTLYLWQNENTVVIGRNQNAWKECRVSELEADGGKLARRLSGGGAVYHDLGNLNFTFLMHTEDYDLARQLSVIAAACQTLGVKTELSGRNDILAEGRKFSGNAFYHHAGRSYHHGTILVHTDLERMQKYLVPSSAKLRAKGVDSVPSRVINLGTLCKDADIPNLKASMLDAFGKVYGLPVETIVLQDGDREQVRRLTERNRQWDWNFGKDLPFDLRLAKRYGWGEIEIGIRIREGRIQDLAVFTDAMETGIREDLIRALQGSRFDSTEIRNRLRTERVLYAEDLCGLFAERI